MRGQVAELGAEVGPENTPRALVGRRREGQAGPEDGFGGVPGQDGRRAQKGRPWLGEGARSLRWDWEGRGQGPGLGVAVRSSGRGKRTLGSARARGRGGGDGDRERGSWGGALREGPRRGGQPGPQAAPGRRSPRPCPSGRSGPWRRREARLSRSLAWRSASRRPRPRPRPLRPPQEVPGGLPRSSSAAPAVAT